MYEGYNITVQSSGRAFPVAASRMWIVEQSMWRHHHHELCPLSNLKLKPTCFL